MKGQLLICLFFLIQLVHATDDPERCCTPDQFQISYGGIGSQVIDQPEALREFSSAAFDFKNGRFGTDVYVHSYVHGSDVRYKIYELKDKDTAYIVVNSDCFRVPLGPPPLRCVLDISKYVSSEYLGDQALLLDTWVVSGSSEAFDGDSYTTTARKNCVPGPMSAVGTTYIEGQKVSYMNTGTYMNFTNSIAEPDYWFVPPASCSNATKKVPDFLFHLLSMEKRRRATRLIL